MKTIQLSKGMSAIVDDDIYEKLSQFHWWFDGRYAVRSGANRKQKIYMHRDILHTEGSIDHINGNRLDNRRANLREASKAQNAANIKQGNKNNKLGIRGVSLHAGKYEAHISVNGESVYLGRFENPGEAEKVYREASRRYFGDFAVK